MASRAAALGLCAERPLWAVCSFSLCLARLTSSRIHLLPPPNPRLCQPQREHPVDATATATLLFCPAKTLHRLIRTTALAPVSIGPFGKAAPVRGTAPRRSISEPSCHEACRDTGRRSCVPGSRFHPAASCTAGISADPAASSKRVAVPPVRCGSAVWPILPPRMGRSCRDPGLHLRRDHPSA